MSKIDPALLLTIATIGLAFVLVYLPWPKSKEYREQEAIAKRHYQEAMESFERRAALSKGDEK